MKLMKDKIFLQIRISEPGADINRIRALKSDLVKTVENANLGVKAQNLVSSPNTTGSKGGIVTIESLIFGVVPTLLPQLIQLLQSWLIGKRKISIQMPNGMKVEFTSSKNLTEQEIVDLIKKLNQA